MDTLHWWHDFVETIAHAAGTIGLALGGYWTYTRFIKAREHIWNLQFNIEPRVEELNKDFSLLVITARLKNIGKVIITNAPAQMFQINVHIYSIDINNKNFDIKQPVSHNQPFHNHNCIKTFDMLSEF